MTAPRTLTQMQGYPTAYEITATNGDSEKRLGFLARVNKCTIHDLIYRYAGQHGPVLADMVNDWDGIATYTKAGGWKFGPLTIGCSGRTERDVASAMNLI